MVEMDRSQVFNLYDAFYEGETDRPWAFQNITDIEYFETEEEACAAQRLYREAHGFHPITGLRLDG